MLPKDLEDKLNNAIDEMDMTTLSALLDEIETSTSHPPSLEDSTLFAKRIIKSKNTSIPKGPDSMKLKKHHALIASIALICVTSTTVLYATGAFNKLTIFRDDATYKISSNTPLTDKEVNELIDSMADTPTSSDEENIVNVEDFTHTYESLEDASKDLNVPLIIPTVLPKGFTLSKEVYAETYEVTPGHPSSNIYLSFDNSAQDPTLDEHKQQIFGISVCYEDKTDVSQSILKTDLIYDHTYTNALGDTYTIYTDEGGIIANITIGDIDYTLCFMNIPDQEIYNTLDHTDLSIYKN